MRNAEIAREASSSHRDADEGGVAKAAFLLLALSLFGHGCTNPSVPLQEAEAPADAQGWPCDPAAIDSRHCRLRAAEGFRRSADPDSLRFENSEFDATLGVRIVEGPSGAGAHGVAQDIMEAWQARLSPAVTWDQDPQGPVGFEVRGVSGSERLSFTATRDHRPRQFHVVSYRNPRTGSILLLEASAAQLQWQEAWPLMAPVFAEVRLTEAF